MVEAKKSSPFIVTLSPLTTIPFSRVLANTVNVEGSIPEGA